MMGVTRTAYPHLKNDRFAIEHIRYYVLLFDSEEPIIGYY